jgi:transcriptional regulator with XRE-family HTH domain
MSRINFENLPLSSDQARAARNYFGWPQAKAAEESGLPLHKIKRFESGNYIPDADFLEALRSFYEKRGYQFSDTPAPGASAKRAGQVFPAGVVGDDGSPAPDAKNYRTGSVNVHHMRIAIQDEGEMGRTLDLIEANEDRVSELLKMPIKSGIWAPVSEDSQAQHAEAVRLLAENGALFARLFGRDIGGKPTPESLKTSQTKPATTRDLLHSLHADAHLAVVGDSEAKDRLKARKPAASVAQALGLS